MNLFAKMRHLEEKVMSVKNGKLIVTYQQSQMVSVEMCLL